MDETRTRTRYIGGSKNIDGIVTRTTSVYAADLPQALDEIARKLNRISETLGYAGNLTAADVGIVRAYVEVS